MSAPPSCPSSPLTTPAGLFTYSFLSSLCPLLLLPSEPFSFSSFSLSFVNFDFHHATFSLSHSESPSFYFFWCQSLCTSSSLSSCLRLCRFPSFTDSGVWSISIPPGWLDSTACHMSPHSETNNEKRNVSRNPMVFVLMGEEADKEYRAREGRNGTDWSQ